VHPLLLLLATIVIGAIAIVYVARAIFGLAWLHRIAWGIQQFRGFRPVWHYDRLSELLGPHAGAETLVGATAKASCAFSALGDRWVGRVFLHGAYWSCEALEPVPEGACVSVRGVEGLTLRVSVNKPAV
jgi:membrane protein implicated in regulation of membrane protease activity